MGSFSAVPPGHWIRSQESEDSEVLALTRTTETVTATMASHVCPSPTRKGKPLVWERSRPRRLTSEEG